MNKIKIPIKDGNLSSVAVLYDSQSNDPNLNWGYTAGIKNGETVANLNFKGFRYLKVYARIFNTVYTSIIDFANPNAAEFVGQSGAVFFNEFVSNGVYCTFVGGGKVNLEKTSFSGIVYLQDLSNPSGSEQSGAEYYIFKIEGVY